jgi:hypothetical protein
VLVDPTGLDPEDPKKPAVANVQESAQKLDTQSQQGQPKQQSADIENAGVTQSGGKDKAQAPRTLEIQYPLVSLTLGGERDPLHNQVSDSATQSIQLHYRDFVTPGVATGVLFSRGSFGPLDKFNAQQPEGTQGAVLGTVKLTDVSETGRSLNLAAGVLYGQNPPKGTGPLANQQTSDVNLAASALFANTTKLGENVTLDVNTLAAFQTISQVNGDFTKNVLTTGGGGNVSTDLGKDFKLNAELTVTSATDFASHSSVRGEVGVGIQKQLGNGATLGLAVGTTKEFRLQGGTADTPLNVQIFPTLSVPLP